jgi:hypothetical protein
VSDSGGDESSQSRRCSEDRDDVAADDKKRVLCELTGWSIVDSMEKVTEVENKGRSRH